MDKRKDDNIIINEKDPDKKIDKETNKEEPSTEEKIKEIEDKLTRAYAEMENQRRRYEKEKDDAFEYGGFAFAKETLNLLDNLDRSKISLENDEKLKNSVSLEKIFEHLDIIKKDMIENKLFHSFELIGKSPSIIKIKKIIDKLSTSESRVLILSLIHI